METSLSVSLNRQVSNQRSFWLDACRSLAIIMVLMSDIFARVWLFPMVSIGCALLVMSGLTWVKAPSFIGSPAEVCARWSYALYLAHMPVFHIIRWSQNHAQPASAQGDLVRWLMFIAGSVCVAAVVERFFERPILGWRDRIAPR